MLEKYDAISENLMTFACITSQTKNIEAEAAEAHVPTSDGFSELGEGEERYVEADSMFQVPDDKV